MCMKKIHDFVGEQKAQVSLEFILLVGSVIVAALSFYAIRGAVRSYAQSIIEQIDTERNASIAKITR